MKSRTAATIGFEPMIPVRFRMLSASSRLRQGFKLTHKLRLLNDGLSPLPVYGLGADLIRSSWTRTNIIAICSHILPLELLSDEAWCEPVHCSLFFQYHHDTCTIAEPNHTYRTHFSFYAGTLIGALPQCVIRKLYRSSRSTSHRSSIEYVCLSKLPEFQF